MKLICQKIMRLRFRIQRRIFRQNTEQKLGLYVVSLSKHAYGLYKRYLRLMPALMERIYSIMIPITLAFAVCGRLMDSLFQSLKMRKKMDFFLTLRKKLTELGKKAREKQNFPSVSYKEETFYHI